MKVMSKTKYASRVYLDSLPFKGRLPSSNLSGNKERLCSTCGNYNKKTNIQKKPTNEILRSIGFKKSNCRLIGKIKYPDTVTDCSWWEEKFKKVIKTKRCSKCGKVKPLEEFYKDKSGDDGHQYKCSDCAIEYSKEWQKKKNENNRNIKSL